jgi:hypothetical protein
VSSLYSAYRNTAQLVRKWKICCDPLYYQDGAEVERGSNVQPHFLPPFNKLLISGIRLSDRLYHATVGGNPKERAEGRSAPGVPNIASRGKR